MKGRFGIAGRDDVLILMMNGNNSFAVVVFGRIFPKKAKNRYSLQTHVINIILLD